MHSQVFVESLDRSFPSVCELDLVCPLQVTDEVKLGDFQFSGMSYYSIRGDFGIGSCS